jgi:hemerythrin-like metal-binding protein
MEVIQWNPSLALDHAEMDKTHQEFAELLNRLADAPEAELTQVMDEFIAHTEAHFAQEQKWMEEAQFPPLHCHVREHEGVLEITREVRKRVAAGETHLAGVLAKAVAEWFADHAKSMDAVLAIFLKQPEQMLAAMQCQPGCETQHTA